jgi:GntR family transcriptional regulator
MERQQLLAEIRSRIDAFETGIPLHKKLKMALQDLIISNRIKRGSTLPG